MTQRAHEVELLFLTMFAAVPLYATRAVGIVPLLLFHAVMAFIAFRVARGRSPEIVSAPVMRAMAIVYVLFYIVDAAVLSRDAIAASTHLVLFIAIYQPIESRRTNNRAQRLLTAALIAVAGIATSTHITITLFVLAFAFLMFRQMMHISHQETAAAIGREYAEPASSRAAAFYLCGTLAVGALLFPLLPRVRNPLVQGVTGALTNASTGLADSINFNESRTSTPDAAIVARVWMGQEAVPFFTPLRLRGAVYDRFAHNEFRQSHPIGSRPKSTNRAGAFPIARPIGFSRTVTVQQRVARGARLLFPVGTYAVAGLPDLYEGPTEGSYTTLARADVLTYHADLARETAPLEYRAPHVIDYPVTPQLSELARRMVGARDEPMAQAAAIERYMSTNFRYVADPAQVGRHPMTVDEFLLRERRGHCEYFAAGMVALLASLDVPARIAGGYYGGRFNPLTGHFVIRREDAHAWVEVWDGGKWMTFDPTPPDLRPGRAEGNLLQRYASAVGESITYFWDRYILTYGLADQVALMVELFTRGTAALRNVKAAVATIRAAFTASGLFTVAALVALMLFGRFALSRRRRTPFDLLADHLRRLGIQVGPAMTVEEAVAVLRAQHPDFARALEPLIALYEEERFSPAPDRSRRALLRRRLAELEV